VNKERTIIFEPAFDRRDPDPSKNYGIHGVSCRFILKGEEGAVQFLLFTNWQLPHVQEEMNARMSPGRAVLYNPMPADLGYHSLKPTYEGQELAQESCPYLDGKPCYYDGSGLNAERVYVRLLEEGSDGVWAALEQYYEEVFKEATS
jgi:hypothetical protein